MQFRTPLLRGTLIKRYMRFLADIRLEDGTTITATCPNTGSMMGLKEPGLPVWLSTSDSPTRKYKHTWELVEVDLGKGPVLVGINTQHPNKLVEEAIVAGLIPSLTGYAELKREQKYGVNSRIDILLTDPKRGLAYVEVKNVHLGRAPGLAEFPDSVTERGAKHLVELGDMVEAGHRAVMCYLVQRADSRAFSLAPDIDPSYVAAFETAIARGVEVVVVGCRITPTDIVADRILPFELTGAAQARPKAPKAKSTPKAKATQAVVERAGVAATAAKRRSRKNV
jgi:sugar fermentation stimulation protein A